MSDLVERDDQPMEPGGFVGDIFFGDRRNSTRGTHRWTGDEWARLPDETEVLMDLLAAARARAEAAEALLGKVGEVLGELIHTVIHAEGAETYTGLIRRANDLRAALHAEIIASQSQSSTEDSGGDLAGDGGE